MKSNILKEVNEIRQMMGLMSEQGVVDAVKSGMESGSKFSDDEYMLLGMINYFIRNEKNIDIINKSFDENSEWVSKYRAPVGRFGKILFDYLNNDGKKYNQNDFNMFLDIFNSPNIYNGNKPKDDEFIELGKSIRDFQYNN